LADQLPPPSRPYPYPPPQTSDLDHWTLTRIQHHPKPPAVLPTGHHLVYFPPTHPTSALLPDGTDEDHWPGAPFVRRLWAGGSVQFAGAGAGAVAGDGEGGDQLLRLDGRRAVCIEKVEDVRLTWAKPTPTPGNGGAGEGERDVHSDKVFVDVVRHYGSVAGDDGNDGKTDDALVKKVTESPTITERRTLVFLTADGGKGDKSAARKNDNSKTTTTTSSSSSSFTTKDIIHEIRLTPSPALLFRFSALTFNAHAIHLDPSHCNSVEGYRERLVHGPLLLVLMFSALRTALEGTGLTASGLEYRNLEPLYAGEELRVCVAPGKTRWNVWVEGPSGRLCVKGSAQVQ
ncbi:Mesaconyl-C(4)-CoA hydratase, partial [Cytospora mali]